MLGQIIALTQRLVIKYLSKRSWKDKHFPEWHSLGKTEVSRQATRPEGKGREGVGGGNSSL